MSGRNVVREKATSKNDRAERSSQHFYRRSATLPFDTRIDKKISIMANLSTVLGAVLPANRKRRSWPLKVARFTSTALESLDRTGNRVCAVNSGDGVFSVAGWLVQR